MKCKSIIIAILLLTGLHLTSQAQKFGYVDTEYILQQMPEYKEAQKKLDELSKKWQQEVESMYDKVDKMYQEYQSEKVLMTEEMKQKREQEIIEKEKEVKEYQKKVFGPEGMLFLKRQELMKPLQDKVYDAVESVAKEHGLQIVFDKAGELIMVYTNPVHDYTEYVLEELDLKRKEEEKKTKRKPTDKF